MERRVRRAGRKKAGYHHGDLRRALIESAIDVVAREDASAVSLRELAQRVGVTHAAPYRHFPDKDALLAAVAAEGFKLLRDAMLTERATAPAGEPIARLHAIGRGYVHFAVTHPGYFKVMFSHVGKPPPGDTDLAREGGGAFSVLLDAIVEAQAAGAARPGDPLRLAVFAWSSVHGLSSLIIERCFAPFGVPTDADRLTHDLIEDLLLGAVPR